MIEKILTVLTGFIIAVISAGGYGGIALLMAIESACIPLPSEVIMPFAGYLVSTGELNLFWVATAGAIGCNLGSAVAYAVGRYGGLPFVHRWGRYVLITPAEVEHAHNFFVRWGSITVFLGRLLPVVRTFIALPAGVARMPLLRFHAYTFAGSWPWCFGLAWIGRKLGDRWNNDPTLKEIFHSADAVIAAVIVITAVWFVRSRLRALRAPRNP
jgi:membrane protein DedA with SNARE-associated domain